jgi:hypothetical protein
MPGNFSVVKHAAAHLPAKGITNKLVQNLQCVYKAIFHLKLLSGGKVIIIIIIILLLLMITVYKKTR